MRLVIDTNIWISGLLWKGQAWQLLRLAEQGLVELCITSSMLLELEEVLSYERLQPRLNKLGQTASHLAAFALSISTPFDAVKPIIPIIESDPDDDIFLVCAVVAGAVYIVTNDRHLRVLPHYQGIPIVTIERFFATEFTE